MVRRHPSAIGLHSGGAAFGDVMHGAAFKDLDPCRLRRPCQPKGEVERMQMRGPHIQNTAAIGGRGTDSAQRVAVQHLYQLVAIAVLQEAGIGVQMLHVTGRTGGPGDAGLEVAIDVMGLDQAFNKRFGVLAQIP